MACCDSTQAVQREIARSCSIAWRTKSVVVTGAAATVVAADQARSAAGMESIRSSMARPRPGDRLSLLHCPVPATPLANLSPVRTPDAPLATDMDPPGLERRLRIRALRFSWIKDAVQAVAFTAAGIWAIYTFWYRERYLPQVSDTDVTVRIVVDSLGERDGIVTVRARTVLENPGHVPARLLAKSLVARGQRP